MIYAYWGADKFGIERTLSSLLQEGDPKPIRLSDASIDEVSAACLMDSFFESRKIIIIENSLEKIQKSKNDKRLTETLEAITPETTVIFVEKSPPRGPLGKYFTEKAKITRESKLPTADLVAYVKNRASETGVSISPMAAERFVTYVGSDYWQIEEELKKLSLYIKDRELASEIEVSDVDELVHSGFEANIFEFMDAISQKNTQRAITLLDSFLESGENELYILTMIARQFRNIALAKIDRYQNEAAFSKNTGLHPYVAKKSILQARNFSVAEISAIYDKIISADLGLKSGQNPKQALQSIILS